jgi:hypothetical protein
MIRMRQFCYDQNIRAVAELGEFDRINTCNIGN